MRQWSRGKTCRTLVKHDKVPQSLIGAIVDASQTTKDLVADAVIQMVVDLVQEDTHGMWLIYMEIIICWIQHGMHHIKRFIIPINIS